MAQQQTSTRSQAAAPDPKADPAALAGQQAQNANRPEDQPATEPQAREMAKAENDPAPRRTKSKAAASRKSTAKKDATSEAAADESAEAAPERVDRFAARQDANDEARKAHAKATGGNLFPEKKPEDGQIVLATKSNRIGSPQFMAQYRAVSPDSPQGAFYSNRNGSYSLLEGAVDSWMEVPG
jgi:hypothetical protein